MSTTPTHAADTVVEAARAAFGQPASGQGQPSTGSPPRQTEGDASAPPVGTGTLRERLVRVSRAMDSVRATGRNQFGSAALSIDDVEDALNEALAAEGILTVWTDEAVELIQPETYTAPDQQGRRKIDQMALWKVTLKVHIAAGADTGPDDNLVIAHAIDVGNTPAGAASFARKRFYKSLLHFSGDPDVDARVAVQPRYNEDGERQFGEGDQCPFCEKLGIRSVYATATGGPNRGNVQCKGRNPNGGWFNHPLPPAEIPA